jgi:L-alanine-DL-glutamate epimerase-like enolase superfamily enzyme
MPRIASATARTVVVPLDVPTSFSTRRVTDRHYTLVRVTGDDPSAASALLRGQRRWSAARVAERELLAPLLVGQSTARVEGLWRSMYDETLLHGRAGSVMRAISAVDIALWDRNARAAGLPLHVLLGAVHEDTVPAYASGGYDLEGKGLEQLAEEMRGYLASGFRAVKIKIGRLEPAADAQRLTAVRDAVGPDVLVMLDANDAWRDLPTALRSMVLWEPYEPYWIEEPFSSDDVDNHARLAERTPVLVATGEIEAGRWRHKHLLDAGAAAIRRTTPWSSRARDCAAVKPSSPSTSTVCSPSSGGWRRARGGVSPSLRGLATSGTSPSRGAAPARPSRARRSGRWPAPPPPSAPDPPGPLAAQVRDQLGRGPLTHQLLQQRHQRVAGATGAALVR